MKLTYVSRAALAIIPLLRQARRSVAMGALIVLILGHQMAAYAKPLTLVAFGDSLTAGYLLPQDQGFPAVLERELKARGHDAYRLHRTVARPWGAYTVLQTGIVLGNVPQAPDRIITLMQEVVAAARSAGPLVKHRGTGFARPLVLPPVGGERPDTQCRATWSELSLLP